MDLLALALQRTGGLSNADRLLLWNMIRDVEVFSRMDSGFAGELAGRRIEARRWNPARALMQATADRRECMRRGWQILGRWDAEYPRLLDRITDPPFVLFVAGRLPRSDDAWLGVVGTRHPSENARLAAWALGSGCARVRLGLVSGLAWGIDGAAHAGAVKGGGVTSAILPGGLDFVTPSGNRRLAQSILENGGALISECPPGTAPEPWRFVSRNRIIAGMAPMLVVVEAPEHSGALISAQFALEEGRDVLVHRAGLNTICGKGTLALASQGAQILEGTEDLLERYGNVDCRI